MGSRGSFARHRLERRGDIVVRELDPAHLPHALARLAERFPSELLDADDRVRRDVWSCRKGQLRRLELQRHAREPLQQRVVQFLSDTCSLRERGVKMDLRAACDCR
jgi:hypothetical protein